MQRTLIFFPSLAACRAGRASRCSERDSVSAQKSHTGRSSGDGSVKYSVPPPARPSSTYSRGTPSTCRSRNRNVTVSAAAQYTPSVRKVSRGWRSRSGRSRS